MADHKYKIGETVTIAVAVQLGPPRHGYGLAAHGKFQIVRPLPAEHGRNQYRVRSHLDGHERVVTESQISPAPVPPTF